MTKKLNPVILEYLSKKLNKKPEQIRPRLSEIIRNNSGLTPNAATQLYALKKGVSVLQKLDQDDKQSLAAVQAIAQVSTSSIYNKVDKRTLNINHSPIHNLSFGDRNTLNQSVITLDDSLTNLSDQIDSSKLLTDDEKSDYKSDIQSLASQVGKSKPNRQIIKAAWESIKGLATIEGFVQLIDRITPLVKPFLG